MFTLLIRLRTIKFTAIFFIVTIISTLLISLLEGENILNKVIVDQQNQIKIKNTEYRFRESIIEKFRNLKIDSLFTFIDTSSTDKQKLIENLRRFQLVNFRDNINDTSISLNNNLSLMDFGIFAFDTISVHYSVNKQKFEDILRSAKFVDPIETLFKYGNFINQEIRFDKKLSFFSVLICFLLSYLFGILASYLTNSIHSRTKKEIKDIDEMSEEYKLRLAESNFKLDGDVANNGDNTNSSNKNEAIPNIDKRAKRILKDDYDECDNKANEVYERSSLFLGFSFITSLFGILLFFYLLPKFQMGYKLSDYIGLSIRPLLALTFFQTLAFYLLRQYKSSMSDYKYFYNEKRNRKRFIISYGLLEAEERKKIRFVIAMELLRDKGSVPLESDKIDDEANEKISELYNTYFRYLNTEK